MGMLNPILMVCCLLLPADSVRVKAKKIKHAITNTFFIILSLKK
jgi:hypothetical protein